MTPIRASAPGKAILSGEYAVLRGAPAISTAVDRRAVVQITPSNDQHHSVSTPGHAAGIWRFTAKNNGQIDWIDEPPGGGLGLFEAGWRGVLPAPDKRLTITIDTREFFAATGTEKLGLGSSAAAMTALVAALEQLDPGSIDVYATAGSAHRSLQNELGSGVDIATGFFGGLIEFRAGSAVAPMQQRWPSELECRFLWSGKVANTMDKIAGLDAADEHTWEPLLQAAESAAAAWKDGETPRILEALRRYTDALRQFSIDLDLGIFDAGHEQLAELANADGLVYKPCGAGGGDIGVVMTSENGASRVLNQFCAKADAAGFALLALKPDPVAPGAAIGADR